MALIKNAKTRLPELGKVKIGEKEAQERQSAKGGTWRAPKKLDHFLITTLERDSRGDLKVDVDLMKKLAPEGCPVDQRGIPKLTEIPIVLLADELDDAIAQSYCFYPGKTLGGRCDGETCTWFIDAKGNPRPPISKPCTGEHEREGWKLHTRFNFGIASGDARWGGFYSFRTTSEISAEQIPGSLAWLRERTFGVLQGLPLTLCVRPMQVAPDGKPSTVYVVHVEMRGMKIQDLQRQALEAVQTQTQYAKQFEAVRAESRRLLRAPGLDEDPVEQADVAEEFHPEALEKGAKVPAGAPEVAAPVVNVTPPATVADALSTPPATLAERIAAAKTPEQLEALQTEVLAGTDADRTAYFAARERLTGKPPPEVLPKTKSTKRAPPPPPARVVTVAQPVPAAAAPPGAKAVINPDEIPF
jgi:hypothetical protein